MDQDVGKLVAELKRTGTFDDTLVLYLQDNGGCAEPVARAGNKQHPTIDRPDKPTFPPLNPTDFITAGSVPTETRDGFPVRTGGSARPGREAPGPRAKMAEKWAKWATRANVFPWPWNPLFPGP